MLGDANMARDGAAGGGEGASVLARSAREVRPHRAAAGQAEVIADIFAGKQVIVRVMPTGAGKSLCYQLPAIAFAEKGGVTLVVSPLIALMKDQVDALRGRGIPAVALTSQANAEEQREMLEGIRAGMYTLVYVAPERFPQPALRRGAGGASADPSEAQWTGRPEGPGAGRWNQRSEGPPEHEASAALVGHDRDRRGAHCISEWGHDFRPDYRRIGEAVRALKAPRVAAFTATATPEVREDIARCSSASTMSAAAHVRGFDPPEPRVRGAHRERTRMRRARCWKDLVPGRAKAAWRWSTRRRARTPSGSRRI